MGLANTPAQHTQLWLNIQANRIYIQVAKSCVNSSNTGIQQYTISQEESVQLYCYNASKHVTLW